ncbi:gas vesicle protein GvpO [Streptomyces sp. NPDC046712]|uniref:gas vesicle protein GvpO n=1 Tax=Streptomyces sp. NPDC046712 TaxID=3154802 RepID=UPI0033E263A8
MTDTSENGTERTDQRQPLHAAGVIRAAKEQLTELLSQPAEAVSACERHENGGWRLSVEVLELPRVPDTMSLLASYEVEVDDHGALIGYRRTRRYERGRVDRR